MQLPVLGCTFLTLALMISALMISAQQRHPPVPPTCAQQCRPLAPPTCAQQCTHLCPAVPTSVTQQ
ncbi:unnamed protein product, partial [Staurois parvus]